MKSLETNHPVESSEIQEEIEVKFMVDPQAFDPELKKALIEGRPHEMVKERGRITQIYLPIDRETLKIALNTIEDLDNELVSDAERVFFSNPDNVTEIRILQREQTYVSEDKKSTYDEEIDPETASTKDPDAFQITIKGKSNADGTARPNIETPITTNRVVCAGVVDLLERMNFDEAEGRSVSMNWHNRVTTIEKMWYDIEIQHPENPEESITVELDIFPDINYLAVAEVEFDDEDTLKRLRDQLPPWLCADITHEEAFKVRNLAGVTDLEQLRCEELGAMILSFRDKLAEVYQPTALGDTLVAVDEKYIETLTFVMLGSFKRWIPQFRRIYQDLERRSAGVYPGISTLDVARRQIQTNSNDVAFRIEREETRPLRSAERDYLRRIKNSDAVYLVSPEARIGRSSGQELAYAVSKGKGVFISNAVRSVAADLPDTLRVLLSACIQNEILGLSPEAVQRYNLRDAIMKYLQQTIKDEEGNFDEVFLERLMHRNVRDLLSNSEKEDPNNQSNEEEN